MSEQAIEIFDTLHGDLVPAVFYDEMVPQQFISAEASWGPAPMAAFKQLFSRNVPPDQLPQHTHWNWSRKASRLNLLAYRGFGIECEGMWQGLMLTLSVGHVARLAPDGGKPLIYVDFLESAPWNVKPLADEPRFKGVGAQLVAAAIRQSLGEGFKGRIGLHALRDAERFYERCGLRRMGPDADYHDLVYFEFNVEGSIKYLSPGAN